MFFYFWKALNAARARYFSDLGHFTAMWMPLALGSDFRCFFKLGQALKAARARYFSDRGHFSALWIPLAPGIDFSRFLVSGRLSTLRARSASAIWAILVPCGFHWLWGSIFDVF